MNESNPIPDLPERIGGLEELAYNLWWIWQPAAWDLFQSLNPHAWRDSDHNPIRALSMLPPDALQATAQNAAFLTRYDAVMERFEREVASQEGWFTHEHDPDLQKAQAPLAYFSAEYGLHSSLPVYAGGLGVLAGDHLKACSDLGVPVVAVGMIYSQSYVQQRIREDGWQEDIAQSLERTYNPITRVRDDDGQPLTVRVPVLGQKSGQPPLHVGVWKVEVGRVPLYLLDPDLEDNRPWDREIASRLYVSNSEQRLRQEILLGMGGMRVLEALGIRPGAVHLNEGHPALATLERIRALMEEGLDFEPAAERVRASTVFTTHTPVSAGTDVFPFQLMEKHLGDYLNELGVERDAFLELGANPQEPEAGFNMTVFALRMADFRNGVSQRHGQVARGMWAALWPDREEEDVPIAAITNGVHLPSWIDASRLQPLLDEHLGEGWVARHEGADEAWQAVDEIPDEALWDVHQQLKGELLAEIDSRARTRWHRDKVAAGNVIAYGSLLDPQVLTLGFARRFTAYKRPDLILYDLERFKKLLTDPLRPVQIIFAGEAHPADTEGKRLIQKIFRLAQDPEFAGRIAFVEDYDQELATYMVHGVDVWLNNPRPPLEASGTSGMKASVNGVPNLSILDGWWIEGYNGDNGWAFGGEEIEGDRTAADAEALYRLLEEEIIPLYYQLKIQPRADDGVPQGFVRVMKEAIKSVAPRFGARRMVEEYVERFYVQAL